MSDVIVIRTENGTQSYYVDRLGFEPIQGFALPHQFPHDQAHKIEGDELELKTHTNP